MKLPHFIPSGVKLIAALLAFGLANLSAQEPFPQQGVPNGYVPNGLPQNGYNPVSGYQPSGVPYQPTAPARPTAFPGGPAAWTGPVGQANGPIYQPGQQPPSGAVPAGYFGPPANAIPVLPAVPTQLCEMSQIMGRVGSDVILTSDVLVGIDDLLAGAKKKLPPDKFALLRATQVQEVTEAIKDLNSHYQDPDPAKAMSLSHRAILYQLIQQPINIKLVYQDFLKNVPKEAMPGVEESLAKSFEESQLPALLKRENVSSRADLETSLRAKGSSLDRERRIFKEQAVAQMWVHEKVSGKEKDEEVTHEEMLNWYRVHLHDSEIETPAQARWEELMVSFVQHPNHDEAYQAMASLGNKVLAGASFADVARSGSNGPTAGQGGLRDWTHKESLSSESLNQAIFTLPVGQLSQILESDAGYHIIRVVERQDVSWKSFAEKQKDITKRIKSERSEKRYQEFVKGLREKYPVWTVFDNSMQQPKSQEDEDRYSRR